MILEYKMNKNENGKLIRTTFVENGGYFQDPDGHVWSAAWNPFTDLT